MSPEEHEDQSQYLSQGIISRPNPETNYNWESYPLSPIAPQVSSRSLPDAPESLPQTRMQRERMPRPLYFWESLSDQFGEDSDIYRGWKSLKRINGPGWQDPNGKTWMDNFIVKGYYVDANKEPHAIVQIPLGNGSVSAGYTDLNLVRPMKEHDLKAWALDRGYFNSPDFIAVNEQGDQWLRNDVSDSQRLAAYARINDTVQDRTSLTTSNPYALSDRADTVAFRNSGDMLRYRVDNNGNLLFNDGKSDVWGDATNLPSGYMGRQMEGLNEAYPAAHSESKARGGRLRTRAPRRNSYGDRVSRADNLGTDDYDVYF